MPFEEMQETITRQISYYFPGSQPADDTNVFEYELVDIRFGYSYVTAYENPGPRLGRAGLVFGTQKRIHESRAYRRGRGGRHGMGVYDL